MQTKTMVSQSAEVTRVVSLSEGDCYKRIYKAYQETKVAFGMVTGVLNNGETVAVTALEIEVEFSMTKVAVKTFGGEEDVALFAATKEEILTLQSDAMQSLGKAVQRAEDALMEAEQKQLLVASLFDQIAASRSVENDKVRGEIVEGGE